MAQQIETEHAATPPLADDQLSVENSTAGLTVVHSTSQPHRTKNDGLQVVIRPGMVYMVEADPPSTARAGRHRRPAPIKAPRAGRASGLLATLAGVVLILAGVAVIVWTMAHQ